MKVYLRDEATGLWFEWNRGHTVNVQRVPGGQDLDMFSVGSFSMPAATLEQVEDRIRQYIEER